MQNLMVLFVFAYANFFTYANFFFAYANFVKHMIAMSYCCMNIYIRFFHSYDLRYLTYQIRKKRIINIGMYWKLHMRNYCLMTNENIVCNLV